MYIIHWKNIITGVTGCGKKAMPIELAEAWIKWLNITYTDLWHWIEEAM